MTLATIFIKSNKNLLRNKLRNILTLLAIIVSATVLVLIIYASTGLEKMATDSFSQFGLSANRISVNKFADTSPALQDGVQTYTDYNDPSTVNPISNEPQADTFFTPADVEKISKIKDVVSVYPQLSVQMEYIQKTESSPKFSTALNSREAATSVTILAGDDLTSADSDVVVVSENIAKVLGYREPKDAINQNFAAVFLRPDPQEQNADSLSAIESIRLYTQNYESRKVTKQYKIKGVTSYSGYGGIIYISNQENKTMYEKLVKGTPLYEKYIGIDIVLNENLSTEELKTAKDTLQNMGYKFYDFGGDLRQLIELIRAVQAAAMGLASIGLLAAFFGVINTQLMAVLERTKEIGLLRALGMSRSNLFWIFSIEAALIGFWGSTIGFGLANIIGYIINWYINTNNLLEMDQKFDLLVYTPYVWFVIIGVTFLTFIAGVIPSFRATKQDPIEALRYE